MRILIITRYFPPYESIASLRPYSWAKYWSRMGHRVSVLTWDGGTTRRYYINMGGEDVEIINVENRIYSFLEKLFKKAHSSDRSVVEEVKSGRSRSPLNWLAGKFIKRQYDCRMPHIHDFWCRSALNEIGGESWDTVVSTYAPPVAHAIAYQLKKRGSVLRWVADYRDLWLEHTVAKGLFPFTLWEAFLEKRYMSQADAVTIVSEPLANILRGKYPSTKIQIIPNGFDKEDSASLPMESIFHGEKVRLVYTGTVYREKQDPSALFKVIAIIAQDEKNRGLLERLEVIFVGGDPANLEELAQAYHVTPWVSYGGRVPRSIALRMQRDAHVLIFLEWGVPGVEGVLTGKLFEYLNAGTEIWGIGGYGDTARSGAGKLIGESEAGKMFGTDSEAIRIALIKLLQTQEKMSVKSKAEILQLYDREFLAMKMIKLVVP